MATLRILKADDVLSPSIRVDTVTKRVNVTFAVRYAEQRPRAASGVILDFSSCSDEQILELASRGAVIEHQSNLRKAWREAVTVPNPTDAEIIKGAEKVSIPGDVNVRDAVFGKARATKGDPLAKLKALMEKHNLTMEQVQAFINAGDQDEKKTAGAPAKAAAKK